MSWRQIVRAVQAEAKRRERAAASAERAFARQERDLAKHTALLHAVNEAEAFQKYMDMLVTLHEECGDSWDWYAIAHEPPPPLPPRVTHREDAARLLLSSYRPGLFDRLFGAAKRKHAALEQGIVDAREQDDAYHAEVLRYYHAARTSWETRRADAGLILARDTRVYPQVLQRAGAFERLSVMQLRVSVSAVEPDAISLQCYLVDEDVVPREEVSLTKTGKLSSKTMAAGRYWTTYQDFLCSAAIRIAREAFAALPVSRAVVNVGRVQLDTSTGHQEVATLLAIHFTRDVLDRLRLARIDPSDSMKNFPHRMKFKKTTGFSPVEPINLDEQWITT